MLHLRSGGTLGGLYVRPAQVRVIAQAIEDVAMLPLLQSLGIDAYQGYASGKPTRIA